MNAKKLKYLRRTIRENLGHLSERQHIEGPTGLRLVQAGPLGLDGLQSRRVAQITGTVTNAASTQRAVYRRAKKIANAS